MNQNYEIDVRENEAKVLLQYWVNIVNAWLEDENTPFNRGKLDDTFGILESMILIYNVFAVTKCVVSFNDLSATYELDYFE